MSCLSKSYNPDTIYKLIGEDLLKEALSKMEAFTYSKRSNRFNGFNDLHKQIVGCRGWLSNIENNKINGIDVENNIELNKLRSCMITLNEKIDNYCQIKEAENKKLKEEKAKTSKREENKDDCQLQIYIKGSLKEFSNVEFISLLAKTLKIDVESISILEVKKGSVKLKIELPKNSANKLIELFERKDKLLDELLNEFDMLEVNKIENLRNKPNANSIQEEAKENEKLPDLGSKIFEKIKTPSKKEKMSDRSTKTINFEQTLVYGSNNQFINPIEEINTTRILIIRWPDKACTLVDVSYNATTGTLTILYSFKDTNDGFNEKGDKYDLNSFHTNIGVVRNVNFKSINRRNPRLNKPWA